MGVGKRSVIILKFSVFLPAVSDSDSSSSSSESDDSDIEKNEDKFSSVLFMQVRCVHVTLLMNKFNTFYADILDKLFYNL